MAKKMFDILPPKMAHKIEDGVRSLSGDGKSSKAKSSKSKKAKKQSGFPLRELILGSLVLILIVCGILYFKLQKVNIEIWPKTETLAFSEEVMADNSLDKLDFESKVIPAEYFEEEKELSQEFLATGNASNEGKASGTIVIYNKYSPAAAISLKSGTHFLSDSGKYFITLVKVSVPAAKKVGGKLVPGSIEVKVQATEGGDSYNIKPAKFSVPKLAGTSYYYSIYGESEKAMTGGYSTDIKKVTDDDIQAAKESLTKQLTDSTREDIKKKISEEYILQDSATYTNLLDSSPSVKAGAVIDKFLYTAKVKTTALAFKKSDLEEFLKQHIRSNILKSEEMLEQSLEYKYDAETVDIKNGKMVLNVEFSAKDYRKVDKDDLISLVRDKAEQGIKEEIGKVLSENLEKVNVNFWPFWTQKAPKDKNKIKIELKFE